MDTEHVEKLKREYTDQYVIVDDKRPELRRFKGMTGTVKTVNMNGRALVEFDGQNNRGWYDIDIDFLKVIDEPLPKEEKPARKPAPKAKKAPSELEKARSEKDAKEPDGKQDAPPKDAPASGPAPDAAGAEAKPAPPTEEEAKPPPPATADSAASDEATAPDKAPTDPPAEG
jgi:hypothetical protein